MWFDAADAIALFEPQHFPVFIWQLTGFAQGLYGFPATVLAAASRSQPNNMKQPQRRTPRRANSPTRKWMRCTQRSLRRTSGTLEQVREALDLPSRCHPGRRLRNRYPSGERPRDRRLALLGPWLQALRRTGREILADLAQSGRTALDISPFRLDRFRLSAS
jgi:hypothetical protein